MTTTSDTIAWATSRLALLTPRVDTYDGGVPTNVPLIPGSQAIRPYIAMWPTPLREPDETSLAPLVDRGRSGDLTLTVAGHSAATVRAIADQVIGLFHRVETVGGGEYVHGEPFLPIRFDDAVTPARYYVPLLFRLTTTH